MIETDDHGGLQWIELANSTTCPFDVLRTKFCPLLVLASDVVVAIRTALDVLYEAPDTSHS